MGEGGGKEMTCSETNPFQLPYDCHAYSETMASTMY